MTSRLLGAARWNLTKEMYIRTPKAEKEKNWLIWISKD
jgi:hypothetical protein